MRYMLSGVEYSMNGVSNPATPVRTCSSLIGRLFKIVSLFQLDCVNASEDANRTDKMSDIDGVVFIS